MTDPSIQTAVRILNEALAADPAAIRSLMNAYVPVNKALADHPNIQVLSYPEQDDEDYGDNGVQSKTEKTGESVVIDKLRVIGLLNGILEPMTGQCIAALYDDDILREFITYTPSR